MRTITLSLFFLACAHPCLAAENKPDEITTLCTLAVMHQGLYINVVKYSQKPSALQETMKKGLEIWSESKTKKGEWRSDNPEDMKAVEQIYLAGGGTISPIDRFGRRS